MTVIKNAEEFVGSFIILVFHFFRSLSILLSLLLDSEHPLFLLHFVLLDLVFLLLHVFFEVLEPFLVSVQNLKSGF